MQTGYVSAMPDVHLGKGVTVRSADTCHAWVPAGVLTFTWFMLQKLFACS